MSVYVDYPVDYGKGVIEGKRHHVFSHMLADTEEELHRMAVRIGLKRSWHQVTRWSHYDITPPKRKKALELGAIDLHELPVMEVLDILRRIKIDASKTS